MTSRYAGESEATLRRAFRAAAIGDRNFSVGGSSESDKGTDKALSSGDSSDSGGSSSGGGSASGGRILLIDEIDALAPATASNASEVGSLVILALTGGSYSSYTYILLQYL